MKWRLVEDDRAGIPLPGPKTDLSLTWTGEDFMVTHRDEDGTTGWAHYHRAEFDPVSKRLTLSRCDGSAGLWLGGEPEKPTVYVPAKHAKRKKVPVPPFTLKRFGKPLHDESNGRRLKDRGVVHVVRELRDKPDPNRQWNRDDALVTAVCGYEGWVDPDYFDPSGDGWSDCPTCKVSR